MAEPIPSPFVAEVQHGIEDLMIHTLAFSIALALMIADPASAQIVTGGAGNTGVSPPVSSGSGAQQIGPNDVSLGNEANRANTPIPGTTPGVIIGGTPTSGPPGTGGTAGGPTFGR